MGYLPPLSRKYKGVILAGFAGLGLCALLAVFGSRGVVHWQSLRRQQANAEAIAFRLEQENERVREHLLRLEHDDAYLERLARERWGWVKPGELVYRVERKRGR